MARESRRTGATRVHPTRTELCFGTAVASWSLAALLLLPTGLPCQQPYRFGPPSTWVNPIHAELTSPAQGRVTAGYEVLLVDRQELVSATGDQERYKHVVYRLLDEGAVQDHSQIEFEFDPTYERLILHTMTVRRHGRTIDQLKRDRIRVVRSESELDSQIFTGTRSLVLVLEDVEPGDVVEYSFTRQGINPVFSGHYMSDIYLQEEVPLRQVYYRVLVPRDRRLFVRRRGGAGEPEQGTLGDRREYLWTARNVDPKTLDADLPSWYDPFPGIQLSDFASWAQVAAWADSLFRSPDALPEAVLSRLAHIRSAGGSMDAQVLAALRYVQDEIRYVGVEIGVNSHRPYPPATVVQRGYGDCKDKVLLLVSMLKGLGVTAHPALVSTLYGGHIRDLHPTANAFDHAIVEATVEGREFWLDPTAMYQRGDLASIAPSFGAALVLGGGGDTLRTIPANLTADPLADVRVSFALDTVGTPATMTVETSYRGHLADRVREHLRLTSPEKLQREYTEFYAAAYPGIRSLAEPRVSDDERDNVVQTTERYTIPKFWHLAANQSGYIGTFDPMELDRVIPSPTATARTMPLAVDYPVHYRYRITASFSKGWVIAPGEETVSTPALRFHRSVAVEDQDLVLTYEYLTLADVVEPAAAADHLDKLSRVRRLLTYSVIPPDTTAASTWGEPGEINWPVLLAGLLATGLAIFVAFRIYRASSPSWPKGPEPTTAGGPELRGLGGWLLLAGIGVCLSPVLTISNLISSASTYRTSSWARLTTPGGAAYDTLWAPVLLLELVYNTTMVVFGCLLVVLYLRRMRWFPAFFVVVAGIRVAYLFLDAVLADAIPAVHARGVNWPKHFGTALGLAMWVGYMFRSRRVQNTFVK